MTPAAPFEAILRIAQHAPVQLGELLGVERRIAELAQPGLGELHGLVLVGLLELGEETQVADYVRTARHRVARLLGELAAFVDGVRARGARVAVDDFGAGASHFGYLRSLKVDLIKVDGQFIKGMLRDPLDDASVRGFLEVARVLGVKTVAEFVDEEAVLARVRELGFDFAQGFHIGRPQPLEACVPAGSD